ncbi:MAG TPA: RNA polymerase sigma factor RpoD/SigA [Solirubrobacteraceae bacterium]|nr:RNA polymerase sigma factor RpoD/SigA [Solirubrobacteraceae bacterium]
MSVTELAPGTRRRPSPDRLLSAAEEVALAKRINRGDLEARDQMIERNLGLVHALARTYRGRGVPFEDLVQEGTVGLMKAVERFDHRHEVKFSTYAVWWIRRSILDALAASHVIRIPSKANRQLAAVRRTEAELERIGLPRASDAEIAERAELDRTTVRSLRAAARVTASLDTPIGADATPLGDLVADDRVADPSAAVIELEDRQEVSALLRLLPERHREVVIRRYGLGDSPVYSHEEIGKLLGVGAERSRQLEHEALHRLRSIRAAPALAA